MFAGKDDDDDDFMGFDNDEYDGINTLESKTQVLAEEMEFFDELDFGQDFADDDDEDKEWAEEEERRQQIRNELDQRKGRGWSDPWEITDEDWMQRRVLEDLPDWTPAMCSRISAERVKVHPGKSLIAAFLLLNVSCLL